MNRKRPPLYPENLPDEIKNAHQYVNWQYVADANSTKPRKVPIHSRRQCKIDPTNADNWSSFEEALCCYANSTVDGVGISLSGHKDFLFEDSYYFLIGLDFDDLILKEDWEAVRTNWLQLGKPYLEVSPSGHGIRILALSSEKPAKTGNAGRGREVYVDKRYLTLTGHKSKGRLNVATDAVIDLCNEWFPLAEPRIRKQVPMTEPETPRRVARLTNALNKINADCDYETWRNIVWAVLSTGWTVAPGLAEQWSRAAPHRFENSAFESLLDSFNPDHDNPVTAGTVFYLAKQQDS